MNRWPFGLIAPMVPAWLSAAAKQFDAWYITVKLLKTIASLGRLLAVLPEWAINHLLDVLHPALKTISLSGDQQVFGIGSGIVSSVHAGLLVQQVKEVVEVLHATSLKRFVDMPF